MAVWKITRLGRVSSLTGLPFPPGSEVVTALFGRDEDVGEDRVKGTGFRREDYLPEEAGPERLEGAYCVWRTRTAPEDRAAGRRLDLDAARELLERMRAEARPDREAAAMALALLLVRKRRLSLVAQDAATLTLRWPREKEPFTLPAPILAEAEAEALQQELLRLFDAGEPA
jgi:hypothetical protein